jgi:hypothetical protein
MDFGPLKTGLRKVFTSIPWQKVLLILAGGLVTYIVVPITASRYNDSRTFREARLARAVEFNSRNNDFNARVNVTKTMMEMYVAHNSRMNVTGTEFLERRKELVKEYRERRLELDGAWWWPGQFSREAEALKLLTPAEMKQLGENIEKYNASVLETMNQLTYLWRFLDSPKYKPEYEEGSESKTQVDDLETNVQKEFAKQHTIRQDVVKKVVMLFEESQCRSSWRDLVGLSPRN